MNIFILDLDIEQCALFHADQHVGKMVLESAQMLCTVLNKQGGERALPFDACLASLYALGRGVVG